jgi:hypothetical protein
VVEHYSVARIALKSSTVRVIGALVVLPDRKVRRPTLPAT